MNKATKIAAGAAGGLLLAMTGIGIGIGISQTDEPSGSETESSGYTQAPDIDQFDESDFGDSAWDEPAYDVGYDSDTDSWTLESGLVVKSPPRWQYGEDTMEPKVTNESGGDLTPYFQVRYFNAAGSNLITSWDCYGDSLAPGQSQKVKCFGEGTYRAGTIEVMDESVSY